MPERSFARRSRPQQLIGANPAHGRISKSNAGIGTVTPSTTIAGNSSRPETRLPRQTMQAAGQTTPGRHEPKAGRTLVPPDLPVGSWRPRHRLASQLTRQRSSRPLRPVYRAALQRPQPPGLHPQSGSARLWPSPTICAPGLRSALRPALHGRAAPSAPNRVSSTDRGGRRGRPGGRHEGKVVAVGRGSRHARIPTDSDSSDDWAALRRPLQDITVSPPGSGRIRPRPARCARQSPA